MSDIKEIGSKFECVKIAMTQDKNGHILKLSIHPNDTPEDLMRDLVGTRYMAVLVRMNDQNEPIPSQSTNEGQKALNLAGALCSDPDFQMWMASSGFATEPTEEATVEGLRVYLGIASRRELKTDADARSALAGLRDDFVRQYRR